jgi:hypothetical protein
MADVKVRVVRALMYEGRRRERDEVLKVPATDAWQLCASGRAELADARDGAVVVEAVQAETKKQLRQAPDPGSPWQRIMRV